MSGRLWTWFAILTVFVGHASSQLQSAEPPDFTKGDKMTGKVTWAFGPTGAYGWVWAKRFSTAGVKQIYITHVDPGSPAVGNLQKDDVILGIVSPIPELGSKEHSGPMFVFDARKELAAAITKAEMTENGGKLVLNVWRKGKTLEVTLRLRTLGAFSDTSPSQCEKTEKIIQQAGTHLEKHGIKRGIAGHFDALGLLATGDKKYLPMVEEYVRRLAPPDVSLELSPGMKAWHWGFTNLLLTEYYLATEDKYVLPAIKEYTTKIAMGQSAAGTWGHGVAIPVTDDSGFKHGILGGYGAINQSGLACSISLVLGRKCGVKSPVVDRAIDKAAAFFRFYVDKGGIPYGDHPPAMNYSANGKTAAAAVLFDLLGDAEAAAFFSRMSVAAYNEIENGHTGNFWSLLWGPLGAGCSGDQSTSAYSKQIRWYTELERRWTCNMAYQGQLPKDPHKYRNWSCTGVRLLHLCLPRKKLHITGKGGRAAKPLEGKELVEAIAVGRSDLIEGCSTGELLELLRSWSPIARRQAAEALGEKGDDVVKPLISMLHENDRYARYGACEGLRAAGDNSPEAAKALIEQGLQSDHSSLRYHAMYAFTYGGRGRRGMTGVAHLALPVMLNLAITLDPADPLQYHVATTLFYEGRVRPVRSICGGGRSLDKVDRQLLIQAVKALLKTSNGGARSMVAKAAYPELTSAELKQLWGDIYQATTERAPSGVMFADGVRVHGIRLMAEHGVKEGLVAGTNLITEDRWGSHGRITQGVPAMTGYGSAVKEYLPMMKQMIEKRYARDPKNKQKYLSILEAAAKDEAPKLISIAPHIEQPHKKEETTPDPTREPSREK